MDRALMFLCVYQNKTFAHRIPLFIVTIIKLMNFYLIKEQSHHFATRMFYVLFFAPSKGYYKRDDDNNQIVVC